MRLVLVLAWSIVTVGAAPAAPRARPPERHASLPSVSPDGRRIAFISERDSTWDLYCMRSDGGGVVRLTRSRDAELVPQWVAGGLRIAFTLERGDTATLHTIALDGTDERIVATVAGKSPALSNDGRRLAYTVGSWTRNRLVVADPDGSNARALTDSSGGSFNLAWSPEGSKIACTRVDSTGHMQVWVIDAQGTGARPLTRFGPGDGRPQWPAWSSDGRRIAVQAGEYDRQDRSRSRAPLWVIDVGSGAATRLAAHQRAYLDETPSWFPDGRRLAFQSDRTGRMEIWVMNADGRRAQPLTR